MWRRRRESRRKTGRMESITHYSLLILPSFSTPHFPCKWALRLIVLLTPIKAPTESPGPLMPKGLPGFSQFLTQVRNVVIIRHLDRYRTIFSLLR